jgi:hypothetical protein
MQGGSRAPIAAVLGAAAIGAIAWFALRGPDAPAAPAAGPAAPAPKPAPAAEPPRPEQATVARPAKPAKVEGAVKYPDGSSMPALNGVTSEVVLQWGVGAFTKVVGTENGPGGWQWYVHENGTRSTTAMVTVNDVPQAMGIVAEPTKPLPMLDEETLKKMLAGQKGQ